MVETYETLGKDCGIPLEMNSEGISIKTQASEADISRAFCTDRGRKHDLLTQK